MDHCRSLRYGPHRFQLAILSLSCFMREDSAEDTSRPTIVLALVKAPFAPLGGRASAEDDEEEDAAATAVADGGGLAPPPPEAARPVESLLILLLLLAEEEVLSVFLDATVDIVMVVFPAVGGNLTLELSVALGLDAIFPPL